MKLSPHNHCESPLTGSTIATMMDKAKALGRTHFAYTDNGHLSSCLKTYALAKKKGLKFIPGLEIYFKDTACDIINGTSASRCQSSAGPAALRPQGYASEGVVRPVYGGLVAALPGDTGSRLGVRALGRETGDTGDLLQLVVGDDE